MSEQKVLQRWLQTSNTLFWNNLIKNPKQQSRNKPSLVSSGFFCSCSSWTTKLGNEPWIRSILGNRHYLLKKLLVATESMSVFKEGSHWDLYFCCDFFVSIQVASMLSYSICKFTVSADEPNTGEGEIEQGGLKLYLSFMPLTPQVGRTPKIPMCNTERQRRAVISCLGDMLEHQQLEPEGH